MSPLTHIITENQEQERYLNTLSARRRREEKFLAKFDADAKAQADREMKKGGGNDAAH
jgi:hypothetical protein